MGDILRVSEVFFSRIYINCQSCQYRSAESKKERPTFIMKLLKMVNFVFIFIIAMVSWASLPFEEIVSILFITFVAMAAKYPAQRTLPQLRPGLWT